jgi:hypothetical protein
LRRFVFERAEGKLERFDLLSQSGWSAVIKPPKPTTIKITGQRFQNSADKYPRFEAKKINPMIIIASGQNIFLDMWTPSIVLKKIMTFVK